MALPSKNSSHFAESLGVVGPRIRFAVAHRLRTLRIFKHYWATGIEEIKVNGRVEEERERRGEAHLDNLHHGVGELEELLILTIVGGSQKEQAPGVANVTDGFLHAAAAANTVDTKWNPLAVISPCMRRGDVRDAESHIAYDLGSIASKSLACFHKRQHIGRDVLIIHRFGF